MKCASIKAFGDTDETLEVFENQYPKPKLNSKNDEVLIRVFACSLSPSDYRMSSGDTDLVKAPKSFPYIPGGDISGIVEQISEKCSKFKVGDEVIGTWDMFGVGGLAEYAVVLSKFVELKPHKLTFVQAAAVADSSQNAMLAIEDARLKKGERVLILGGSGGVGTSLIQLAKNTGASFIAATSTDEPLLKSLGVDRPINYTQENWWEIPEFKQNKFDVIFDCAEGKSAWKKVKTVPVLKNYWQGGRFMAVVPNDWRIVIHTAYQMSGFMMPIIFRPWQTFFLFGSIPKYICLWPAPRGDSMKRMLKLVEDGKINVVVEPNSPFPFTTEGVRAAWKLHESRHAHGKVVIQIADEQK